ncbi:MAG: DUF2142 domain-containing protein [Ruthenibacterium lactatiformans]
MAELTKKCKRLWTKPGIRWLCGYFFVLLCGVGLVYYWRVAYSLGAGMPGFAAATTLIICGGFSAVYLLVFLAAHFLKQNLALKTAVLVFLAGLCFVFANPPMQAPDETMHFLRAYAVGSGQFLFDEKQQFPNDVNLLVRDFPGAYINGVSGEKLAPDDPTIADAFARYSADKAAGAVAPGAFTPVQQLVPYFPQALGVAVGRLFGADALACMYLARAANLLCYAVLCGYAAAVIRRFSAVLIALAISPVSLFMAGSCSSDGLFMGLTWIFIALCLSDVVTKKRLAVLALCFGLTFHAKYTTLALLPLLLLLPFEQKPRKGKKALSAAAQRWGVLAVCLAAGVIIYALLTGYTALASNYGRVPYADTGVDPGRQLAFVFSNLPRYLAVLLYSVYRDKANLFTIGNFGWMDMTVPFVSYFRRFCCCIGRIGAGGRAKSCAPPGVSGSCADVQLHLYGMYLAARPSACRRSTACRRAICWGAVCCSLASMLMGRTMALQNCARACRRKRRPRGVCCITVFASRSSARCCCSRRITSGRDAVRRLRIALKEDPAFDRFC